MQFEITGTPGPFFLCHCSRCRKGTGSAHAANIFVPGGTLEWRAGRSFVRGFKLPDTRHARAFCTNCGAPVPNQQGDVVVLPAGALDTPMPVPATAHICGESRADWDAGLANIATYPGLPTG
ncbi:MAG: GFA family protein [Pseudomonadota bacterium]|nr:GFA family protein [Pseudomonadota bacterium]